MISVRTHFVLTNFRANCDGIVLNWMCWNLSDYEQRRNEQVEDAEEIVELTKKWIIFWAAILLRHRTHSTSAHDDDDLCGLTLVGFISK